MVFIPCTTQSSEGLFSSLGSLLRLGSMSKNKKIKKSFVLSDKRRKLWKTWKLSSSSKKEEWDAWRHLSPLWRILLMRITSSSRVRRWKTFTRSTSIMSGLTRKDKVSSMKSLNGRDYSGSSALNLEEKKLGQTSLPVFFLARRK